DEKLEVGKWFTKRAAVSYILHLPNTEKWGEIVSEWLFEDSKLKRKSRRTKKSIFEELQDLVFMAN
nr:hypothetical protein [Globicatella sanguinis]